MWNSILRDCDQASYLLSVESSGVDVITFCKSCSEKRSFEADKEEQEAGLVQKTWRGGVEDNTPDAYQPWR